MQKRLALLIVLFSLLMLAACSPASQTSQTPTATSQGVNATPTTTGASSQGPVNVYIGTIGDASDDGSVISLNGANGQALWNHNSGHVANSTPVLDHGVAYVGSDTSLSALSMQDGSLLWSYSTPNAATVLGVANGLVFGTTNQDNPALYALDATSGKARWTYTTSDQVTQAVLSDGIIYAHISKPNCHCSNPPSTLLALNASDGTVKWQTAPFTDFFYMYKIANGLIYGSHATAEGPDSDLQARRASDGSVAWQFPKEPTSTTLVAVDGSSVYALTNDQSNFPKAGASVLYALNATTGATLWQQSLSQTSAFTGMLINQTLYLGNDDGSSLIALNAADGKQLWQTALDTSGGNTSAFATPFAEANGTLYITTAAGFTALKASDGSVIWNAPLVGYIYPIAVQNGIVYGATTSKDTSPTGHNAVFALKASDGSSLWNYPVAGVFSLPALG